MLKKVAWAFLFFIVHDALYYCEYVGCGLHQNIVFDFFYVISVKIPTTQRMWMYDVLDRGVRILLGIERGMCRHKRITFLISLSSLFIVRFRYIN